MGEDRFYGVTVLYQPEEFVEARLPQTIFECVLYALVLTLEQGADLFIVWSRFMGLMDMR
jgi:hypothetical protein